jgi:carboxyl-terminal processing protease
MKKYWLPISFALTLVLGIFIGNLLARNAQIGNTSDKNFYSNFYSKIDLVLDLVKNNYVDKVDLDKLEEQTIPNILSKLDPHSSYIPASELKEAEEPLEGKFEGIGVQFNIQSDTVYIVNTIPNGPSEKVGIMAGDRIVRINDSLFVGKRINNELVMKYLKGKRGTKVNVEIKRNGLKDLIPFDIIRDKIPIYSIHSSYMIDKNIGYIKLSQFSITSADEFNQAAQKLLDQGMTKLIFDLRGNGGGILDAAIKIADNFLDASKLIVYTEGNSRPRTNYNATDEGICEKVKLAILVDTWSASASEIVSGAIQDNDRGLIIGRRTFGKGLVQEPIGFNDGSAIRLTTARYYTPTGRCIQKSYKDGYEAYEEEVGQRIAKGELENQDSIAIPDSLKFTTPGGKVVYGGGGIMPDIFVPVDTSYFNTYFNNIVNRGLVYQYALNFTDANRKKLSTFSDYKALNNYLKSINWLSGLVKYAESKGVVANSKELQISENEISLRFRAYVIRNIFDDLGFYPILNSEDNIVKKAVESLNSL